MNYLHHTSFAISVLGAVVIVYGVVIGLVRFVPSEVRALRGAKVDAERKHLRHLLGYYLLLGLEFLIAADIIDTLMKPTVNGFNEFITLGVTIVVRTIISWSLNAELKAVQDEKQGEPKELPDHHQLTTHHQNNHA